MLIHIIKHLRQTSHEDKTCFVKRLRRPFRNKRIRRITRRALGDYSESPFQRLYLSNCNQSMITYTGFDYEAFNTLLTYFRPYFLQFTPYSPDGKITRVRCSNGRKRKLSAEVCLGLVLAWTRTRGSVYSLQMDFGLTHSCLCLWLRFGIRILAKILVKNPLARVKVPTREEVALYQRATAAKYPTLHDVWATVDGLNLYFQCTNDNVIQGIFYNGWLHGHFVSNVFVFAMDGTIRICGLNAPGTMHDSTLADYSSVYHKLQYIYEITGGKVVVDSAFRVKSNDFIIKSSQTLPDGDRHAIVVARDATSVRQAAEWGMRQFQASFPRMKDAVKFELNGERRIIMRLIVYLFNYRANVVGCNQIQSTFMPHLEANWSNARSMFRS
jgi:hypothetical protein